MTDKVKKLRDAARDFVGVYGVGIGPTGFRDAADRNKAVLETYDELVSALTDFDAQPEPEREHILGCDEYHQHKAPKCCNTKCWCRKLSPQPDLLKELEEIESVIDTYDPQTQAQLIQIAGKRLLSLLRERMGGDAL